MKTNLIMKNVTKLMEEKTTTDEEKLKLILDYLTAILRKSRA